MAQEIKPLGFVAAYLLSAISVLILHLNKSDESKRMIIANLRMTAQLFLAGYILLYIFKTDNPLFPLAYIFISIIFAIRQVLNNHKSLNANFKKVIVISIIVNFLFVLSYFLFVVLGLRKFQANIVIPISGMLLGNVVGSISLAIKSFFSKLEDNKDMVDCLINLGVSPKEILKDFISKALSTALIPNINSMMTMGIITLPGMVTGQILAGSDPILSIMYQIAIIIGIASVATMIDFFTLYFGSQTLYNDDLVLKKIEKV